MAESSINVYYRKTKEHRASWVVLGRLLELKPSDLKAIDIENRGDTKRCLLDMLDSWLQSSPARPDEQLDDALRELYTPSGSQGKT